MVTKMDLKQLKYFTAVAEEGTISAAAKRLYVSQPPLSTQMQLLEKELGCKLFERGQKKIRLTETGRLLYERAQTLLRMETTLRQDVEACARTEKDTIRIGVVSSVICTRAGEWISDFLKKNDDVIMEITESNTYSLIEKLRTDQIHAALVRTPFPDNEFSVRPLAREKMIAVGAKRRLPDRVTMSILEKYPLILYRRWEPIIREAFHESGLEPRYICICDDARTAVDLAERAVGISLVPGSAADLLHSEKAEYHQIVDCPIETEIVLIYKETAFFPESVKKFTYYLMNLNK